MSIKTDRQWQELYDRARQAGLAAGRNFNPRTMVVQQHANMADDNSPVVREWVCNDGVCGFAWIVVRPGTCSFARWVSKAGVGRAAYTGGIQIWVSDFNQSMERKEAYAAAFAGILCEAGIRAHSDSRMD